MARKRSIAWWCAGVCFLLALVAASFIPRVEVYRVYNSPSGAYHLTVYRYVQLMATLPGDSSGAPGYVRLFDAHGRKLGEAKLSIVAAASSPNDVKWDRGKVFLPGAFDLTIPPQ